MTPTPAPARTLATTTTVAHETIGQYVLLRVIAAGSMGTLYESVDLSTGSPVALKVLHRDRLSAADMEGRIAAGLTHPGIVSVYEYGNDAGRAYIAMEYVDGSTLRDLFDRNTAFTIDAAVHILSQLLDALQYAHERGVWHRDIKPANVLISRTGQIKIADFGIATAQRSAPAVGLVEVMGTPGYVAPETYLSDIFDSRVDVFAAGAVLYQLLTGVPAFVGTADEIMLQVCYEKPLPPSMAGGMRALRQYDAVVMQALSRQPNDRYSSALEFRDALLRCADGYQQESPPGRRS